MNLNFFIYSFLSIFSLFIFIFIHIITQKLLFNSGILSFDDSLIKNNLITLFFNVILTCNLFLLKKNMTNILFIIFISFYFLICCYELLISLKLIINSQIFISYLYPKWIKNINSTENYLLSRNFKCCGFFKTSEISKSQCEYKKPYSCFYSINKYIKFDLEIIGKIHLFNFLIFILLIILLIIEYLKNFELFSEEGVLNL